MNAEYLDTSDKQSLLEQMRSSSPAFVEFADETREIVQSDEPVNSDEVEQRPIQAFFMGYADGVDSTKPTKELRVK